MNLYGRNKLRVELGKLYINRTYKFILPLISSYGQDFKDCYNLLIKVAVGINDYRAISMDIKYDKHIFVLIDVNGSDKKIKDHGLFHSFDLLMSHIRHLKAYETDYVYSFTQGLHMIVFKIPSEFIDKLEQFKEGRYSKMFSQDEIKMLFSKSPIKNTIPILVKDSGYKVEFEKEIKKHFLLEDIPNEDWEEFDFPPEFKEEVFNCRD